MNNERARAFIAARGPAATASTEAILDELGEDIEIIEGDATFESLRRPFGAPLLVTGHLTCRGLIALDERSPLIVLGDLHAHTLWVWMSALFINGNMKVTELVYLHSGNDFSAVVGGASTFTVLYEGGMHTTLVGPSRGLVLSTMNQVHVNGVLAPHAPLAQLQSVFVDDVLNEHGLDDDLLFERLECGQSVIGG